MPIDSSALPFGKKALGVIVSGWKDAEHDRKLAKAYEVVNERDDNRCRVTGLLLYTTCSNDRFRREHHHLKGRRVRPEWIYRPERILLVSAYIHKLLQGNALIPDGVDARKPIKFAWNQNIVPSGKEPIRLRPEVAA